ncbi:MAG: potassium transporter Kup [Alphaproteobacteria bacterium]|nr:potassium transporter Kup [Alphaproteobacteria bacterium]MBV9371230.1 potassium transporter Kup [Alphaproteobacteria bacterium]MBV9902831.1 potassium transporter Kup [Alphaproteobacteria bacterium]
MSEATAAAATPDVRDPPPGHAPHGSLWKLTLGAIGIVFGDIGTSPLYAFRETFAGHHRLPVDKLHIFGVLSLIFWSMMIVVTLKYVVILMRADNKGEGGSLALLALISRKTEGARWGKGIVLLGVFACALFYGDSMITPAVSVLSAVEGLVVVQAGLQAFVLPIAIGILIALFMIQRHGTAAVGTLFGPVVSVYFATLATLGALSIAQAPGVMMALNPLWAIRFFLTEGFHAFVALGSVVLAVTGAEALYADMGHFGRRPIKAAWIYIVLPALMVNYLGQGALLIGHPGAIENPFFLLAPEWFRLPLVLIATAATVIASQAVISGAFSVTQQAIHLGFVPRLRIEHTSEATAAQIYIPAINWALMIMVIILVLVFRNSSNLTAAYGIAVTGAMFIDTCLLAVVLFTLWNWNRIAAAALLALFFVVDAAYFSANLLKVPSGGWFPLMIGFIAFTFLTTWAKGRQLLARQLRQGEIPPALFIKSAASSAARVPGTAVFMTSQADGVPHALLHNLKHNKVLHQRSIFLKVAIEDVPYVDGTRQIEVEDLGEGFYRIVLHFGFMEDMNVPEALAKIDRCGFPFKMMETSFFLSRQTPLASKVRGMAIWREKLFAWMMRNAESPMEFFGLPPNRVVEMGSQVKI